MRGYRKLILGSVFILCSSILAFAAIRSGTDLVGLSTVIGAMAAGVGVVVYGNIKENNGSN